MAGRGQSREINERQFDIDKLRVATPCPAGWENMAGGDRQRYCGLCELNVYNFSGMTAGEIERLVVKNEGRLCIRLHRRADGTVITKDCPVGIRAYRKRVTGFAAAAFAAVLGLFSISFGQKEKSKDPHPQPKIERTFANSTTCEIRGKVTDQMGAVVPGAIIKFVGADRKETFQQTNDEGSFHTSALRAGIYKIEISQSGFRKYKIERFKLNPGEKVLMTFELEAAEQEVIGIVGETTIDNVIDINAIKDLKPAYRPVFDLLVTPSTEPGTAGKKPH